MLNIAAVRGCRPLPPVYGRRATSTLGLRHEPGPTLTADGDLHFFQLWRGHDGALPGSSQDRLGCLAVIR